MPWLPSCWQEADCPLGLRSSGLLMVVTPTEEIGMMTGVCVLLLNLNKDLRIQNLISLCRIVNLPHAVQSSLPAMDLYVLQRFMSLSVIIVI